MFKCEIGPFGDTERYNQRHSGAYKVLAGFGNGRGMGKGKW